MVWLSAMFAAQLLRASLLQPLKDAASINARLACVGTHTATSLASCSTHDCRTCVTRARTRCRGAAGHRVVLLQPRALPLPGATRPAAHGGLGGGADSHAGVPAPSTLGPPPPPQRACRAIAIGNVRAAAWTPHTRESMRERPRGVGGAATQGRRGDPTKRIAAAVEGVLQIKAALAVVPALHSGACTLCILA